MPFAKKIHMHVEFAGKTRVKTVRRLRLDFTLRAQLHKDMRLVLKKFRFQQLRDEMEANRIIKEPAYLIINIFTGNTTEFIRKVTLNYSRMHFFKSSGSTLKSALHLQL